MQDCSRPTRKHSKGQWIQYDKYTIVLDKDEKKRGKIKMNLYIWTTKAEDNMVKGAKKGKEIDMEIWKDKIDILRKNGYVKIVNC